MDIEDAFLWSWSWSWLCGFVVVRVRGCAGSWLCGFVVVVVDRCRVAERTFAAVGCCRLWRAAVERRPMSVFVQGDGERTTVRRYAGWAGGLTFATAPGWPWFGRVAQITRIDSIEPGSHYRTAVGRFREPHCGE